MVDTDVSHAVEERLSAIEARLDTIESGATPGPTVEEEEEVEEEPDEEGM